MFYAIDADGNRIEPKPKSRAYCPICQAEVTAKCGELKEWHWSHLSLSDCDTWSEGQTKWHRNWKEHWPKECQEVVIGRHRADVKSPNGIVVEFQHSNLSLADVREREDFYGKMIWVFDITDHYEDDKFQFFVKHSPKGTYYTFRWKNAKKFMLSTTKPAFLDYQSDKLFLVKKCYKNEGRSGVRGWGMLVDKADLIKQCGGNLAATIEDMFSV